ncbi:retropepsin-like aspartic protease family protein [Sphingomonas sp. KC8]|uniref:retropepsin-like aspartic protease family protein n=1 Tax=Sphingomonas sp. KC8 TaxID=1030157 RepID=UPI000248B54D|nr:TIGR02281 family clan AA aspartic protease [Sphingomonas sp. KC8]ARS26024.1 aspartyl protease [Sphingomonas sp. KC8]
MNGDQALQIIATGMCLVLVVSALVSRRVPLGQTLKMALGWAAIFAVALFAYSFRDDVTTRLNAVLYPESGMTEGQTLRIAMADDGHFWIRADVNGVETRFMIDSGATTTALSAVSAAAAGIPADGFEMSVATANGTVIARRGRIGELRVGPIRRTDLAVITAAEFGDMNVLGMNFLSSLRSWGVEGRTLVLKP